MRERKKTDIQLYELATVLRADQLSKEGKLNESLSLVQQASDLGSESGFLAYNMGVIFQQNERTVEAIAAYRKALHAKPEFYEALVNLGNALAQHGEHAEAFTIFEEARKLNDKDADLHYDWAIALEGMGRNDEAIVRYQEAIRINPNHIRALFNLGRQYVKKGDLKKAVETLQKAKAAAETLEKAHRSDARDEKVRGKVERLLNLLLQEQETANEQDNSQLN